MILFAPRKSNFPPLGQASDLQRVGGQVEQIPFSQFMYIHCVYYWYCSIRNNFILFTASVLNAFPKGRIIKSLLIEQNRPSFIWYFKSFSKFIITLIARHFVQFSLVKPHQGKSTQQALISDRSLIIGMGAWAEWKQAKKKKKGQRGQRF